MRKGSGWAPALSGQIQWGNFMLTIGVPDTVRLKTSESPRQDTHRNHTKTGSGTNTGKTSNSESAERLQDGLSGSAFHQKPGSQEELESVSLCAGKKEQSTQSCTQQK